MTSVDYSRGNLAVAKVVVKAMYRALGYEPIGVQLALTPADVEYVWEREAKKYLLEQFRRRHHGQPPLSPREAVKLQDVPVVWDEMAGERPGDADPILARERKHQQKFFMSPEAPARVIEVNPAAKKS
jgi:hypothetical protein